MTSEVLNAVRFFQEHAGYSVPPGRMVYAKMLAEAEAWAEIEELEFVWDDDDERAYCYCGDPECQYDEDSEHEWETLACRH